MKGLESERKKEETSSAISTLFTSQRVSKKRREEKVKTERRQSNDSHGSQQHSDEWGFICCTRCPIWPPRDWKGIQDASFTPAQQLAGFWEREWRPGLHSCVWAMSGILIWASGGFAEQSSCRRQRVYRHVFCVTERLSKCLQRTLEWGNVIT